MRIGTDIIEVGRISDAIEKGGKAFLDRVFTECEQEYCESRKVAKYQHYAGRFAAKESIFKAVSGEIGIVNWTDIEVVCTDSGRPEVRICGKAVDLDVSISHCKEYATAVAIWRSEV